MTSSSCRDLLKKFQIYKPMPNSVYITTRHFSRFLLMPPLVKLLLTPNLPHSPLYRAYTLSPTAVFRPFLYDLS